MTLTDYTMMASLNNIERWGTIPHLRRQTVAAHSFDVCWTIDWIVENVLDGKIPAEDWRRVMRWAMRHDMMEGLTGDIPSPAKRVGIIEESYSGFSLNYPKVGELGDPDPKSKALIKLADRLCMLRDAWAEVGMGNTVFRPIVNKCAVLAGKAYDNFVLEWGLSNEKSSRDITSHYLRECPALVGIAITVEQDME